MYRWKVGEWVGERERERERERGIERVAVESERGRRRV
jgi:hypothetical protein